MPLTARLMRIFEAVYLSYPIFAAGNWLRTRASNDTTTPLPQLPQSHVARKSGALLHWRERLTPLCLRDLLFLCPLDNAKP